MKSILVTGGAGFIGSNFIPYFLAKYPEYRIINLDKLTYAGTQANLVEVKNHPNYHFIKGDICNRKLLHRIFRQYDLSGVIHFAAESHVDNSIVRPDEFIKTNVNGTFTLLDCARHYWLTAPFQLKSGYTAVRFFHVSTDEVYGSLGETGYFTEKTPYAPNSPYSASKASSDLIVRSYFHTYGIPVIISNCSNNYGPKQHPEKLIPTIICSALQLKPIPIYGDGKNIRDWLFVNDHCRAIDLLFHQGRPGETYNIGTRNEICNLDLAVTICRILDELSPRRDHKSYQELITYVKDRPGHDRRYAIDPTLIETEFNFRAEEDFNRGLRKTVNWYLTKNQ